MSTKLNKELTLTLIELLKNGKYEQGFGALRQMTRRGEHLFCCLGVACDAIDDTQWKEVNLVDRLDPNVGTRYAYHKNVCFMPSNVQLKYNISPKRAMELMVMNDTERKPFTVIADQLLDWLKEDYPHDEELHNSISS